MAIAKKTIRLLILEDSQNEAERLVSLFRNAGHANAHGPIDIAGLGGASTGQQSQRYTRHSGRSRNRTGFRHGNLLFEGRRPTGGVGLCRA